MLTSRWCLLLSLVACQSGLKPVSDGLLDTGDADTDTDTDADADADADADSDADTDDCPRWFRDDDEDGYGADNQAVTQCDQPAGYVALGGDCDDGDPAINPGSTAQVDGVDSDCDGNRDWLVTIYVSGDDAFDLCVDNESNIVGSGLGWHLGFRFDVWMTSGRHVVGIKGWDLHYSVTAAIAHIEMSDGTTWVTDGSWKFDPDPQPDIERLGWCSVGFQDAAWLNAVVHGPMGTAPWNNSCGLAPCVFPTDSPAQWIWDHFPVALNTQYLRKEMTLP